MGVSCEEGQGQAARGEEVGLGAKWRKKAQAGRSSASSMHIVS